MLDRYPFLMVMSNRARARFTFDYIGGVVMAAGLAVLAITQAMLGSSGYLWLLAPAALIGLGVLYIARPPRHELAYALRRFGGADAVGPYIEADFLDAPTDAPLQIGSSWLVHVHWDRAYVGKLNEIAWVYAGQGQLYIMEWSQAGHVLYMTNSQASEALDCLQAKIPWAVFGYSHAIANSWQEDPQDMYRLIKEAYDSGRRFADIAPAGLRPTSGLGGGT